MSLGSWQHHLQMEATRNENDNGQGCLMINTGPSNFKLLKLLENLLLVFLVIPLKLAALGFQMSEPLTVKLCPRKAENLCCK